MPVILIIGNLMIFALNEHFMKEEFSKLDLYSRVPDADLILEEVYSFFRGKDKLEVEEFNEREIQHMEDVRRMLNASKIVLYAAVAAFFILLGVMLYHQKVPEKIISALSRFFVLGSLSSLAFFSALIIFLYFFFDPFFTGFHRLFFEGSSWLFDPRREVIVLVFPNQIFVDIVFYSLIYIMIELVIILAAGFFLKKLSI